MAESHQVPSHDLDDARDDLSQASLALNTAYDRLQDLRTSLRNFTAQRDQLAGERARRTSRILSAGTMGPNHSAIVFSDSDEESEIDMELLREALPVRLLELTSRWGRQHARLNAARQSMSSEARNHNLSSAVMSPSEEPRSIYPPRRRRTLPQGGSSRDGRVTPPGPTSPARRSILEAHLRQMRHAASPGESSTILGRRIALRTAAAAQDLATDHLGSSTGLVTPSDTTIHSTLPSGIERRPSTSNVESRAASHLRYSLLPNPSSGVRLSSGSRLGPALGGTHSRFPENRPRTARSNSLNALTPGTPSTSNSSQQDSTLDASTQAQFSGRLDQLSGTVSIVPEDDDAMRFNLMSELDESTSGSYRVRRRLSRHDEEHVFNINWRELLSEGDREDGLSDPAVWTSPSQRLPRPSRARPVRIQSPQDPETDDTVVQEYAPFFIREGREGSVQRRRGWARLDADGDEISTEDEAAAQGTRTDSGFPRTRNWSRGHSAREDSTVAMLHRSMRHATLAHRDVHSSHETGRNTREPENNPRRILNNMFRPLDSSSAYANPLPTPLPDKATHVREHIKEVQVVLDGRIAGR